MQGAGLRLQAGQAAVLSAQVQHGLKMLQMSALELEQEVAKLLESNPLLERPEETAQTPQAEGDEISGGQPASTVDPVLDGALDPSVGGDSFESGAAQTSDDAVASPEVMEASPVDGPSDFGDGWAVGGGRGDDSVDPVLLTPARVSLREHLLQQVNVSALEPADAAMARLIVEALDDDGYLRDDWREILAMVAPSLAGGTAAGESVPEDDPDDHGVANGREPGAFGREVDGYDGEEDGNDLEADGFGHEADGDGHEAAGDGLGADRNRREINGNSRDTAALIDQFKQSFGVALRFVQSLDPAGVGARSVDECLRLQIERLPETEPGRALALRIVGECIGLLSSHDVGALTRKLQCNDAELAEAHQLIRSLAPRPAQAFAAQDNRYVVPEVIVRESGGKWLVAANPDASPQVRINRAYANVVRSSRGWSNTPMGGQLSEARWLLRNLRQRADTILRVADAIVAAQQRFFEYGDIAIRPLFLRDIAAQTGLHESTISRVTAGKYMATPRGLIEFKHFFGSRLEAADGFRVSSRSIQVLIRDILGSEDPAMPLSDIRLTKALAERGVKVARRTVTKYRDAIGIPPVDARRLNAMGSSHAENTTRANAAR